MKTEDIIKGEAKYILQTYGRPEFVLERGNGVYLFDTDGNRYLDFVSGLAVNAFGHGDYDILKAIEEPPASTVFILLAEEVPEEHSTVASRCVRVDFPPLPDDVVATALVDASVDRDLAAVLAEAAGGRLDRARLLATDPAFLGRRDAWRSVPDRLDGTGAAVAVLV